MLVKGATGSIHWSSANIYIKGKSIKKPMGNIWQQFLTSIAKWYVLLHEYLALLGPNIRFPGSYTSVSYFLNQNVVEHIHGHIWLHVEKVPLVFSSSSKDLSNIKRSFGLLLHRLAASCQWWTFFLNDWLTIAKMEGCTKKITQS